MIWTNYIFVLIPLSELIECVQKPYVTHDVHGRYIKVYYIDF